MLDVVGEAVMALQEETTTYSQNVQLWMRLMGASFLISIFFVRSKIAARWILAAFLSNVLGLVIGKMTFPDESRTVIGTYVHILFWPAILWVVWLSSASLSFSREANSRFDWIFIVWLGWASLLMFISLVFDFRTLIYMWV
ncbi:MAG: hypothetical protein ACI92E_003278 [Oceanicoccus sp.]|jgi:hypothetical protein